MASSPSSAPFPGPFNPAHWRIVGHDSPSDRAYSDYYLGQNLDPSYSIDFAPLPVAGGQQRYLPGELDPRRLTRDEGDPRLRSAGGRTQPRQMSVIDEEPDEPDHQAPPAYGLPPRVSGASDVRSNTDSRSGSRSQSRSRSRSRSRDWAGLRSPTHPSGSSRRSDTTAHTEVDPDVSLDRFSEPPVAKHHPRQSTGSTASPRFLSDEGEPMLISPHERGRSVHRGGTHHPLSNQRRHSSSEAPPHRLTGPFEEMWPQYYDPPQTTMHRASPEREDSRGGDSESADEGSLLHGQRRNHDDGDSGSRSRSHSRTRTRTRSRSRSLSAESRRHAGGTMSSSERYPHPPTATSRGRATTRPNRETGPYALFPHYPAVTEDDRKKAEEAWRDAEKTRRHAYEERDKREKMAQEMAQVAKRRREEANEALDRLEERARERAAPPPRRRGSNRLWKELQERPCLFGLLILLLFAVVAVIILGAVAIQTGAGK